MTRAQKMSKQVKLQNDTYELLTSIGQKKETYDMIVRRLITFYLEHLLERARARKK